MPLCADVKQELRKVLRESDDVEMVLIKSQLDDVRYTLLSRYETSRIRRMFQALLLTVDCLFSRQLRDAECSSNDKAAENIELDQKLRTALEARDNASADATKYKELYETTQTELNEKQKKLQEQEANVAGLEQKLRDASAEASKFKKLCGTNKGILD